MPVIDADTIHQLVGYADLIDALEAAHRDEPPLVDRSLLQAPDGTVHAGEAFLVLPAWHVGRYMGAKLTTVFPQNPGRDNRLPAIHGVYQLFDADNGAPLATLDGKGLTLRKTAADSALGARLLAPPDARTLLMVGAGALAPHLAAAHCTARPGIERVLLWNRTRARRDDLAEALRAENVDAEPVDSLSEAVPAADLICCATASMEPLIEGQWLRPGQHLDLVGSFTPSMREADDECVRRASLFVDTRATTVDAAGDLFHPITDGVIEPGDIRADLFELCDGRHRGRQGPDEITLFKNGGGAHLDLFTAEHIYRRYQDQQPAS